MPSLHPVMVTNASLTIQMYAFCSHSRREKAVKELLARSAPRLDEWMVRGIAGSMKIPMAWIDEAKVSASIISDCIPHMYDSKSLGTPRTLQGRSIFCI